MRTSTPPRARSIRTSSRGATRGSSGAEQLAVLATVALLGAGGLTAVGLAAAEAVGAGASSDGVPRLPQDSQARATLRSVHPAVSAGAGASHLVHASLRALATDIDEVPGAARAARPARNYDHVATRFEFAPHGNPYNPRRTYADLDAVDQRVRHAESLPIEGWLRGRERATARQTLGEAADELRVLRRHIPEGWHGHIYAAALEAAVAQVDQARRHLRTRRGAASAREALRDSHARLDDVRTALSRESLDSARQFESRALRDLLTRPLMALGAAAQDRPRIVASLDEHPELLEPGLASLLRPFAVTGTPEPAAWSAMKRHKLEVVDGRSVDALRARAKTLGSRDASTLTEAEWNELAQASPYLRDGTTYRADRALYYDLVNAFRLDGSPQVTEAVAGFLDSLR